MRAGTMFLTLVITMFLMVIGILQLQSLFISIAEPPVTFIEDKTALNVENEAEVGEVLKTGYDVFMFLTIADEYTPFPKSIKVNDTPIIDLDEDMVSNKWNLINKYYSSPIFNFKDILTEKVKSVEYVENKGEPKRDYNGDKVLDGSGNEIPEGPYLYIKVGGA